MESVISWSGQGGAQEEVGEVPAAPALTLPYAGFAGGFFPPLGASSSSSGDVESFLGRPLFLAAGWAFFSGSAPASKEVDSGLRLVVARDWNQEASGECVPSPAPAVLEPDLSVLDSTVLS